MVAVLVGLVVFGLAVNGLSLLQSLVTLAFGAAVLLLAWLWQLTIRRAETAPPLTRRERVWNAWVFAAWLTVVAALAWWYVADRAVRDQQQRQPPATNSRPVPEDPADDAESPEESRHKARDVIGRPR